MKKITKRYIIYIVCSIMFLSLIISGLTYAYWQKTATQSERNIISTLSCLDIDFISNTPSINIDRALPLNEAQGLRTEPYNFTVINNCDNYVEYKIIISVINNGDNLLGEYIKVALDGEDLVTPTVIVDLLSVATPDELGTNILASYELTSGIFHNKVSDTYDFRMWLNGENEDIWTDETISGKSFQVKLSIIGVIKNNPKILRQAILAQHENITELPVATFTSIANTQAQSGLYKVDDDYTSVTGEKSYYFRGTHSALNNNLIFGGYQWKIIRIDGNGNIRLIYNGVCTLNTVTCNEAINAENAGTEAMLLSGTVAFNPNYEHVESINYNYSPIKGILNEFYDSLSVKAKSRIVATEYCNDKSCAGINCGTEYEETYYASLMRLQDLKSPTLICSNAEDRITLNIGLITADEIAYAGGVYEMPNSAFYLNNGYDYWTMTPYYFGNGYGVVWNMNYFGVLANYGVNNILGVRPVITLDSKTIFASGDGSLSTPYIINTNP